MIKSIQGGFDPIAERKALATGLNADKRGQLATERERLQTDIPSGEPKRLARGTLDEILEGIA